MYRWEEDDPAYTKLDNIEEEYEEEEDDADLSNLWRGELYKLFLGFVFLGIFLLSLS